MASPFASIIGHERIISYLERVLSTQRAAHAYLFEGAAHLGKRTVAEIFASVLLGAEMGHLRLHPDFIFLELGINEKTGKTRKNIGIEEVRGAIRRLALSPMAAASKVAIINGAETLSLEAANALLKTLEEPSGRTFIILVAEDPEALPKTIISRTQVIRFSPVHHEKIESRLISRGIREKEAHNLAKASFGAPGLALEWSRESDALSKRESRFKEGIRVLASSDLEKLKFAERALPDRGSEFKTKALELLDMWELIFRDMLFSFFGVKDSLAAASLEDDILAVARSSSGREIVGRIRAGEEARAAIAANVSPRFAIENFLLKI